MIVTKKNSESFISNVSFVAEKFSGRIFLTMSGILRLRMLFSVRRECLDENQSLSFGIQMK